jgi:hypothetical protein
MSSRAYSESELESYLRGELPQNEIDALEDELLRNDELFQRLQTLEMTLIDSYLEDEMTGNDKQRFETTFLNNPENQWKLEKERVFRKRLEFLARRRLWQPQLTAAAVILISLAILGWFALQMMNQRSRDLSTQATPPPTPQATVMPSPEASPSPSASPAQQKLVNPVKDKWLYLRNMRTGVAGTNDARRIAIAADTTTLRLRYELPDDASMSDVYEIVIKDEFDYPILPSQGTVGLKPVEIRYHGRSLKTLSLDVPVSALKLNAPYQFEIAKLHTKITFVLTKARNARSPR